MALTAAVFLSGCASYIEHQIEESYTISQACDTVSATLLMDPANSKDFKGDLAEYLKAEIGGQVPQCIPAMQPASKIGHQPNIYTCELGRLEADFDDKSFQAVRKQITLLIGAVDILENEVDNVDARGGWTSEKDREINTQVTTTLVEIWKLETVIDTSCQTSAQCPFLLDANVALSTIVSSLQAALNALPALALKATEDTANYYLASSFLRAVDRGAASIESGVATTDQATHGASSIALYLISNTCTVDQALQQALVDFNHRLDDFGKANKIAKFSSAEMSAFKGALVSAACRQYMDPAASERSNILMPMVLRAVITANTNDQSPSWAENIDPPCLITNGSSKLDVNALSKIQFVASDARKSVVQGLAQLQAQQTNAYYAWQIRRQLAFQALTSNPNAMSHVVIASIDDTQVSRRARATTATFVDSAIPPHKLKQTGSSATRSDLKALSPTAITALRIHNPLINQAINVGTGGDCEKPNSCIKATSKTFHPPSLCQSLREGLDQSQLYWRCANNAGDVIEVLYPGFPNGQWHDALIEMQVKALVQTLRSSKRALDVVASGYASEERVRTQEVRRPTDCNDKKEKLSQDDKYLGKGETLERHQCGRKDTDDPASCIAEVSGADGNQLLSYLRASWVMGLFWYYWDDPGQSKGLVNQELRISSKFYGAMDAADRRGVKDRKVSLVIWDVSSKSTGSAWPDSPATSAASK